MYSPFKFIPPRQSEDDNGDSDETQHNISNDQEEPDSEHHHQPPDEQGSDIQPNEQELLQRDCDNEQTSEREQQPPRKRFTTESSVSENDCPSDTSSDSEDIQDCWRTEYIHI